MSSKALWSLWRLGGKGQPKVSQEEDVQKRSEAIEPPRNSAYEFEDSSTLEGLWSNDALKDRPQPPLPPKRRLFLSLQGDGEWDDLRPDQLASIRNTLPATEGAPKVSQTPRQDSEPYDISNPVCSLLLVRYKSRGRGLKRSHILCTLPSKFPTDEAYQKALKHCPQFKLIRNDVDFFYEMRRLYRKEMRGWFRRNLSLKSHQGFRILRYRRGTRATVEPFPETTLEELTYLFNNPNRASGQDYIEWVFRLRRPNERYAIEFIEGWSRERIIIAGVSQILISLVFGIVWSYETEDVQTAFTVATFILTFCSILFAMLAVFLGSETSR